MKLNAAKMENFVPGALIKNDQYRIVRAINSAILLVLSRNDAFRGGATAIVFEAVDANGRRLALKAKPLFPKGSKKCF